jgi:RNA polymerase sigma factor (sigma-70 family)
MLFSKWIEQRELQWIERFAYDLIQEVKQIMTDEELIDAIRSGDEASWGPLFVRWEPRIKRFLSKIVNNRSDVEEISQDVMLNIVSAIRKGQIPQNFKNWAYAIARNASINATKKSRPVSSPEPEATAMMQGSKRMGRQAQTILDMFNQDTVLDKMIDAEKQQQVNQALDDLANTGGMGSRKANYLRRYYFDDEQLSDIAGQEVPLGTVKRTIHGARKDLKKILDDKGVD